MTKRSPSTPERVLRHVLASLIGLAQGVPYDSDADAFGPDRSLVLHCLFTIFRRRAELDWYIDRLARRRVRGRLRRVLWWGMSQLLWSSGVPEAAVVDTCVRVSKQKGGRGEGAFVNALLRAFQRAREGGDVTTWLESAPPWVRLNLGEALWKRWSRHLSEGRLTALAEVVSEPAPLVVRVRDGQSGAVADENGLSALTAPSWAPEERFFECDSPQAFFRGRGWLDGMFYIQDPSTLLAPSLLDVCPGERIGDLCAAPGGKSVVLAERLSGKGALMCMDRSRGRLPRLVQNVSGVGGVLVVCGDAVAPPLRPGVFDGLLLDVPCTNTGVVRRRPDVRWTFTENKLRDLTRLQSEILDRAACLLRDGGRLVYSTCSVEPEENETQVKAFLEAHPEFTLSAEKTLMPEHEHDGGYAALLRKGRRYSA